MHHNAHEALQAVLQLVPTAPSLLMPMLVRGFPFRMKQTEIQVRAIAQWLSYTLQSVSAVVPS